MLTARNFTVAMMTTLDPQASSQLECTISANGNVSCTATSDCDMELGVMCLEQDFVTRLVDPKDTTNCETMSTSTEVSDDQSTVPTTQKHLHNWSAQYPTTGMSAVLLRLIVTWN